LNEKNSEALIKDAIQIAKPYFFLNTLRNRLEDEARRVFDAFKAEGTANDVLLFYMMNKEYPDVRKSAFANRFHTYSEARDRQMYLDSLFPDMSISYGLKKYISLMGSDKTYSA